jgi:hypothetical protein
MNYKSKNTRKVRLKTMFERTEITRFETEKIIITANIDLSALANEVNL